MGKSSTSLGLACGECEHGSGWHDSVEGCKKMLGKGGERRPCACIRFLRTDGKIVRERSVAGHAYREVLPRGKNPFGPQAERPIAYVNGRPFYPSAVRGGGEE